MIPCVDRGGERRGAEPRCLRVISVGEDASFPAFAARENSTFLRPRVMQQAADGPSCCKWQATLQLSLLQPVRLQQLVDFMILVGRQIHLGELVVVGVVKMHHRRRARFPFDAQVLVRVGKPEALGFEKALDLGQPVQLSPAARDDLGMMDGAGHHRAAGLVIVAGGRGDRHRHG